MRITWRDILRMSCRMVAGWLQDDEKLCYNERNCAGDIPLGMSPVFTLWESPCKQG